MIRVLEVRDDPGYSPIFEMSKCQIDGPKAVTNLVESDMSISTDASQKEIDTANSLDGSFVLFTFLVEIFSFTVQNMCVIRALLRSGRNHLVSARPSEDKWGKGMTHLMSIREKKFLNMNVWYDSG